MFYKAYLNSIEKEKKFQIYFAPTAYKAATTRSDFLKRIFIEKIFRKILFGCDVTLKCKTLQNLIKTTN